MKKHHLIVPLLAVLLFASCDPYSEHVVRGTLYQDVDMLVPAANDTLIFRETDWEGRDAQSTYLGWAVTDSHGRFGFSYIRNLDNPYQQRPGTKMTVQEYYLIIIHHDDTLYYGNANTLRDTLQLYPGCWTAPWAYDQPQPEDGEGGAE